MKQNFKGWKAVASILHQLADGETIELNAGQRASLKALAERLPSNGVIIADEVGMGKTRIAATLTKAVVEAGGRAAILVPPGLSFQWNNELRKAHVSGEPKLLRSLWQFLKTWERDLEPGQSTWLEDNVVLISHAFCNWRLGSGSDPWRWALLPTLYAHWRKLQSGRLPRDFHGAQELSDEWVLRAAEYITKTINQYPSNHPCRLRMDELQQTTPWPAALKGAEYTKDAELRPNLEKAVGLGLGAFDLVIVDEAHKSRGETTVLNRLLDTVLLPATQSRRLLMTATPIELDSGQWQQTLSRAGIADTAAAGAIQHYNEAVKKVRTMPTDAQARASFDAAAEKFQQALTPYLLRRDKSEVAAVKQYAHHSAKGHHDYRNVKPVAIATTDLQPAWQQAICAAEALSFVARGSLDHSAKRLRLTLGNGHGIAAIMDEQLKDESADQAQQLMDAARSAPQDTLTSIQAKKQQRIEYWKRALAAPFSQASAEHNSEHSLYQHPSIQAAIQSIEKVCDQDGEKVLVFGRFTRPMQALVRLLNARRMLHCLANGIAWPQASVHQEEQVAVKFALKESNRNDTIEDINLRLKEQYQTLAADREYFRNHLPEVIDSALNGAYLEESPDTHALFQALRKAQLQDISLVSRALQEILPKDKCRNVGDIVSAFESLVSALNDTDRSEAEDDSELADERASEKLTLLLERLNDEYSRTESGFARLMNGNTKPSTRRLLQLAFNREQSHLKVLVAQSVVGREGLNLHEACRTVVLLHAEWNPGVVEQQIGRVDRINSLWEKRLHKAIAMQQAAVKLPQIQILPIIFAGTYDEENWQVLMQRWDDLRAQLHGVVIPPSIAECLDDKIVQAINGAAPRFSPS